VAKSEVGISVALPEEARDLLPVVKRLNKGKPEAGDLSTFRAYLRRNPESWRDFGDLSEFAADGIIQGVSGDSLVVSEALDFGRLALREELGYSRSSGLERLLADHVVLCWMRMQEAEHRYTLARRDSLTIDQAAWLERRLSAVQARYLRACEVLARVRKLVRDSPAVQVNIAAEGGQQVNVAGDVRPENLMTRR
jgi:hypothetical protein